jgi:pimeloyl-ACP methyl ester carboxylesterase
MPPSQQRERDSDDRGFVLLHGAMLGHWIWDRVTPLLDRPALSVDLPGRGTKPADITQVTLGDAVDSVVADVDVGPFKRVVLVAHSLSGILVPAVTTRLGDRVAHTVFVSAAVPRPGNSYLDVLPTSQRLFLRLVLAIQKSGPLTPPWATRRALCNDLDDATTQLVVRRLTREAPRFYREPVPGEIPPRMPMVYVKLTRDRAFSSAVQDEMITRLQSTRVETIEAGHLPMLGHPSRLAAILNSLPENTREVA